MKRVGRQENAFIMLLIIQCREKGFNVFYPWHFLEFHEKWSVEENAITNQRLISIPIEIHLFK